jgi:hypothetical protein
MAYRSILFLCLLLIRTTAAAWVIMVVFSGTASAQSVATIAGQYVAWRGGDAFLHLKSVDETGMFTDGGLSGPSRLIETADGKLREELHFGPLTTSLVAETGHGSYANFSGQVTPLAQAECAFAAMDAQLLLATPFANMKAVAIGAAEQFDGSPVRPLTLHGAYGAVYVFLIAPDTGVLRGIQVTRNGATGVMTFSDWRLVNGVRLPFFIHKTGDIGFNPIDNDTTDFRVASATLNGPLTTLDFAPPASRDDVSFAQGQTSSGWIPFKLTEHLIFLPITVNGHKVQAIFDSGAGTTVIDSRYAASIGVSGAGHFKILGMGGPAAGAVVPGTEIKAGGMTLTNIASTLIDLGLPGTKMSPPLVAIFGAEAFNQAVVDIDYPHHRLRFLAPNMFKPPAGASILPLIPFGGGFILPVVVEGRPAVPVILDTGNDGTFQLFPDYWQTNNMLAGRASSVGRGGGVGGMYDYDEASLTTLGIGDMTLRDVGAGFELPGSGTENQTVFVGNLGDEIISRFHVMIDVPGGRIAFVKTAETTAPFAHDLVGLETMPDGPALKIFFIHPNSPAAAAGLKAGEEITAIDGQPTQGSETPKAVMTSGAGQTLSLRLRNGQIITIIKRRYD